MTKKRDYPNFALVRFFNMRGGPLRGKIPCCNYAIHSFIRRHSIFSATCLRMEIFAHRTFISESRTPHYLSTSSLLYLTNQGQITHNLRLDAHIHMQFRHVWSFSLAVRFSCAKTPKVCGAINVLSLDFSSVVG